MLPVPESAPSALIFNWPVKVRTPKNEVPAEAVMLPSALTVPLPVRFAGSGGTGNGFSNVTAPELSTRKANECEIVPLSGLRGS